MTFPTLKAEMAREGIKPADVAKVLGVSPSTVYNKISGVSPFMLSEAVKIKAECFPNMTIEELFLSKQKGA